MIVQGSPEWFAARCGKVTASRIADLMARTKSGYGASRANYMAEIIVERLTGHKAQGYTNSAMQWGVETEPQARAGYSFERDVSVVEVGFIDHPTISMAGASPDGLVCADGLVEIKCPHTATHIDILLSRAIPDKYIKQMQFQMACTGRDWCDFVCFDPRLPSGLQMFIERVNRDDLMIREIEAEVRQFLAEAEKKQSKLEEIERSV